jgi:hypothetical protein
MNAPVVALLALAGIFGSALLGLWLRAVLPAHHLSPETKESVRLGMGLVATMTALLLGLLVASAKGAYDTQRSEVIQMAAKIDFLDRVLANYGSETTEARGLLRGAVDGTIDELWPDKKSQVQGDPVSSTAQALYQSIQQLSPHNDEQRSLKGEALASIIDLSKTRWLLFAQADSSIATPLLVMVVLWLAVTFLSFGLFAPSNKTVIATLLIVALSVSSAIFLIMELDRPFNGVIQISSAPLRNASSRVGR